VHCTAWLSVLSAIDPGAALARERETVQTLLLEGGDACPDAAAARAMHDALRRHHAAALPPARANAAVARARAAYALRRARQLYLRTAFAGCVAVLSISEQELGRHLADPRARSTQRAHRLLAEVNLWLGVCQFASGDPQAAAASFIRSSRLPSSPLPDPQLFPPRLLAAYRAAVEAPRQQVSCAIRAPLTPGSILVDGKGPTVQGDTVRLAAGTHYLVLGCERADASCQALRRAIGPGGWRAMRLEARPLGCVVQLPGAAPASDPPCIHARHGGDVSFVAAALRESGADQALVATLERRRVIMRLLRGGRRSFERQLVATLANGADRAAAVRRNASLVLAGAEIVARRKAPRRAAKVAWYRRWWVWAIVAGVAAGAVATTSIALATRSRRVKVVFGR